MAGIGSVAGAVVGRWPNPWWALAITAGAVLVVLAVLSFVLDLVPRRAPQAVTPSTSIPPPRTIDLRPFIVWSPQSTVGTSLGCTWKP